METIYVKITFEIYLKNDFNKYWKIKMTLLDLDIKFNYDSDFDDLINDFYNPVLSNSVEYLRLSGFFSSSSLAILARGMEKFIKNNGKMSLICSALLSKEDIQIIKETDENPSKIIAKYLFNSLNIENEFIKDHVGALGWMLANKKLEIKIAIVSKEEGIFHPKVGILKDNQGNALSFSGSENETEHGLRYNIEEFKVFKNWVEGEKKFFESDYKNFNKQWNNLGKRTNVYNLPEAIIKDIIKIAPKNKENINLEKYYTSNGDNEIMLRKYQKEAISEWFDNGKKGIFEMATGSGKTITALECVKKLKEENKNSLLTVISCPYTHLVDQWEQSLNKYDVDVIIKAYSSKNMWEGKLKKAIRNLNRFYYKNIVVITTHTTFSKENFINIIDGSMEDIFVIVDEVHGVGANSFRLGLKEKYKYRLGLSATPERWGDEEGSQIIINYFDGVVFKFTIRDAIIRGYLTKYKYYPCFVNLNNGEIDEYNDGTVKIAKAFYSKNKDGEQLAKLYNQRMNVINKASEKYSKLELILDENPEIKDLIIFCSDTKQLNKIKDILTSYNIKKHDFIGSTTIEERENLIEQFSSGDLDALVAMKCLDEGVDIPSAKTAIIMASTSNPRQYIQRRGRILRKSKDKNIAIIYDMIVIPNLDKIKKLGEKVYKFEKTNLKKETNRYREFAKDAENDFECLKILHKLEEMLR
jgi:superfamily II DNA or RNA helicase